MAHPRSQSESACTNKDLYFVSRKVSFSPPPHGGESNGAFNMGTAEVESGGGADRKRHRSSVSGLPTLVVELYELHHQIPQLSGGEEWIQLGRWIKYEELIESADGRFGLPRIPVLSYRSLKLLDEYLRKAIFLTDVEAETFGDIALTIAEAFSERAGVKPRSAKAFMNTFCKDLRRIPGDRPNMRKCALSESSTAIRKHSAFLEAIAESMTDSEKAATDGTQQQQEDSPQRKNAAVPKKNSDKQADKSAAAEEEAISADRRRSISVGGHLAPQGGFHDSHPRKVARRQQIAHKFSAVTRQSRKSTSDYKEEGAEACQIFVGIIEDIREPRVAVVRLKEAIVIPECIDSLPIRFVFTVVGPELADVAYSEIGRAVATLVANQGFQEIAYSARDESALLKALETFMNSSAVIPPADIYKNDLVHVEDIRKTLRNRKTHFRSRKATERPTAPREPSELTAVEPESKIDREGKEEPTGRRPWERTGRPFGGLIHDLKNRAPFYLSDFKDALNGQCLTSIVFMFFVVFAPAISFGQVMTKRFRGYMGITEVFVAQGIAGVIWSLVAAQPMLIQAATGPFLAYESALFEFCDSHKLEFLPVRFWVGMWAMIISVIFVLAEGSFLIGFVTRFTEDVFTCLVAGIFIYNGIEFVVEVFEENPLLPPMDYCPTSLNGSMLSNSSAETTEDAEQPNTAMVSLVLVVGTFCLAFLLKLIRTSRFFGRTIRKALGDFGLPLTILIMVLIAKFAFKDTYLQFVDMPATFGLTQPSKRGWFVQPMGTDGNLPAWIIGAAIVPAFLITILFFAETDIVQLLLTSEERGLKKPMGFHWDLVITGAMIFAVSIFGLPWMCCAAVQSLTHAASLSVMKKTAPGEKPSVDHVIEQRVSGLVVSVLIGACSCLGSVLKYIPISVLMGVFVYLGVSCLLNVQFIHRLILLFVPRKYFPEMAYCKEVSTKRMHAYTIIQLVAFVVLWVVHMIKQTALGFPFVIALEAVARRFLLTRLFSANELNALDASDAHGNENGQIDEARDIYDESPLPM